MGSLSHTHFPLLFSKSTELWRATWIDALCYVPLTPYAYSVNYTNLIVDDMTLALKN